MMVKELQKQFDLDVLIGIGDADKYLNPYELFVLNFGSCYKERFDVYYKYKIRKQKNLKHNNQDLLF